MENSGSSFIAGMYLLETLTSGMYNDPFSIYREYIQNSVDAFDCVGSDNNHYEFKIDIQLDPFNRTIVIRDNAFGIKSKYAEAILSSVGSSTKIGSDQRGFRGIGRLGGIAFSDSVTFNTKAKGENVESIQHWDCRKLRQILGDPQATSFDMERLFIEITTLSQKPSNDNVEDSFFEVRLGGVESFRDQLFDVPRVMNYLSQVAPVSFDPKSFSFSEEIASFLKKNVPTYSNYIISLNGMEVRRLYKDVLDITGKGRKDKIESIEYFDLQNGGEVIACAWVGNRRDLLGAISKAELLSGLRVKIGNLSVGDNHLLDKCFRETRFNSYFIGEIHVINKHMLPNGRRDDFVDNRLKEIFYSLVEKHIGIPLSRKIRSKSKIKSATVSSSEKHQALAESTCVNLKNKSVNEKNNEEIKVEQVLDNLDRASLLELLKNCRSDGCNKIAKYFSQQDHFLKN